MPFTALLLAATLQAPIDPVRDSVEILKAARASQARFEKSRRRYLPWGDVNADRHDEIIGRYYWWDDHGEAPAPVDSAEVIRMREQLIVELGNVLRVLPADEWTNGQRVRYLLQARRHDEAHDAALECRPESSWWCLGLLGLAEHALRQFVAAESTFARALGLLSENEQCRWRDITYLLDGPLEGYQRSPCVAAEPAPAETRFWWLADPLYIVPGNDRLTEHYARMVMERIESTSVSPTDDYWAEDLREVLIRFGWPVGWARERQARPGLEARVNSRYARPSRSYEPPARFVASPAAITPGRWTLVPPLARGGYVPSYLRRMDTLANQVAVFHREDGIVLVAGYDLSRDSVGPETRATAGLVFAQDANTPAAVHVDRTARARGTLQLRAPAAEGLLSLEVLASVAERGGRERHWVSRLPPAPGKPGVSDVLLLSRADSLPQSLKEAAPLALPGVVISAGTVGLFWEVYGLGPGATPYNVEITVARESEGFLRRAARALRLVGERPQVRLGWTEVSDAGSGPVASALALDVSGARPGVYTLRLAITARGDSGVTQRSITIK